MLGLHPFGASGITSPFLKSSHASQFDARSTLDPYQSRHRPASSSVGPHLDLTERDGYYQATLRGSAGFEVEEVNVSIRRNRLEIAGIMVPFDTRYEYVLRRATRLFVTPRLSQCIGMLNAGTAVRGTAPSSGWIQIEDGWLMDDGSLELVYAPKPQRFTRHAMVPSDADLPKATRRAIKNGVLVLVPKKKVCSQVDPVCNPVMPAKRTVKPPASGNTMQPPPVSSTPASTEPSVPPVAQSTGFPKRPTSSEPHTTLLNTYPMRGELPRSDPVLVECTSSPQNVQMPKETSEHWHAMDNGAFALAAHDAQSAD